MSITSQKVVTEQKPIFILGVPRSGTTLLSLILDSHRNIAVGRETGVMRSMAWFLADEHRPENKNHEGWFEKYQVSRAAMTGQIRDFLNAFFLTYARKCGKKRWGEKTPFHTQYVELINEIFPDAQFIHIVRDPRAVVASRKRWGVKLEDVAQEWLTDNLKVSKFGERAGKERYFRFFYKDLVLAPEATIRSVLDFLGEDWDPNVMQHHEVSSARNISENREAGVDPFEVRTVEGKAVVEGGKENDPSRAIDKESLEKWKGYLRKVEIRRIQEITREGMEFFGYPMATGLIPLIGKVKLKETKPLSGRALQ